MKRSLAKFFAVMMLTIANISPVAAEDRHGEKTISLEAIQSDFEALYSGLKNAHADLYAHRSKKQYDLFYKEMMQEFENPQSLFATQVAFQKFTAFGNVAHANIAFPNTVWQNFRENGGRAFPIYIRIVDGRAYVGEDYSDHDSVDVGVEILSLNSKSMSDWIEQIAGHISADTPYIAHSLLEFQFPKYLWLELGEVKSFELKLRLNDGVVKSVTVPAIAQKQLEADADIQTQFFSLDSNERASKVLDNNIGYLRPGPFYNVENPENLWSNSAFVAFVDTAFTSFIEGNIDKVIIDLRQNPGGDNSFSDHLVAWFADKPFRFCSAFLIRSSDHAAASNQRRLEENPEATQSISARFAKKYATTPRGEVFDFDIPFVDPHKDHHFSGDIFVLINRHSYSNATNVAAIIQDYDFGIIVGEKTSDMATTYGALETFVLPATGIKVGFPKAHIIRPSGDSKSDGVSPDWPIETPIVPSDKDEVLLRLVARLEERATKAK